MKKLLLGASVVLVVAGLLVAVATARDGDRDTSFDAELHGFSEVPAVSTTARGDFKARLRDDTIEFRLRFRDLEAPVRFAHIHFGQEDVNGGVAAFLCGGGPPGADKPACPQSGTVTGTVAPSDVIGPADQGIAAGEFDELVRAMKAGITYANVHSDKFPGGEIRGQIEDDDDDDEDHGRGRDGHDDD